ncbi:MAG: RNA polymerase sigma-70 factor [Dehalococcoidia bacterium]
MTSITMAPALEAEAQAFEEQRPLLFGVAYRMLGSAAEAEDIVQDAYLRYRDVSREEIRNERSYLVTVVSRLCLDHLKSARVQRERYVGPWLPEPISTSEADWRIAPEGLIDLRESVSMAFLVLLESLGPVERAVLLLHDVFDYSHAEIARILDRSEAASRQQLKRARERLATRQKRFAPADEEQRRLTLQFVAAAASGDLAGLLDLLTEDAMGYSDGGGKVAAATKVIEGRDRITKLVGGFSRKEQVDRFELVEVNGQPAIAAWRSDRLTNVILLGFHGEHVSAFYIQRNPDKLRRLSRALGRPSSESQPEPGSEPPAQATPEKRGTEPRA